MAKLEELKIKAEEAKNSRSEGFVKQYFNYMEERTTNKMNIIKKKDK